MYLSVIIPAYNEEKRLPKTLREIDNYLSKQSYDSEVIVVDGGSTDKTPDIVREMTAQIKNLKLVEVKNCRGKGQAVKEGMLQTSGKFRIFTDADNSTSIEQVEKMWPHFNKGYDLVIGSRDIRGAVIAVPQSWLRRYILGNSFNLFVQIISGLWGIWDTQCGFKGFTEKAAKDIFPKLTIEGWAFDVEVLVLAKKLGHKFKEIPVTWINDPESKVKFKGMIKMLFEVFRIRWNLITRKYNR